MASSNKHWPSMFKSKSKPCNNQSQFHQLISSSSSSHPTSAVERCPEPKSRWNPKAEQIRILEGLFNSGMVNPPREEIRKIRIQLQEYGHVGDANVFYWFQNRKSRTKQKLRHLNIATTSKTVANANTNTNTNPNTVIVTSSVPPISSQPHTGTVGFFQPASQHQQQNEHDLLNLIMPTMEPSFCPVQQQQIISTHDSNVFGAGFGFPDVNSYTGVGQMSGFVSSSPTDPSSTSSAVTTFPSSSFDYNQLLGNDHDTISLSDMITLPEYNIEDGFGQAPERIKCNAFISVFINDVAFEVAAAPLNVREAFGADAALYFSSGHMVLMDEWGVTLDSMQNGCYYYLMRTFSSPDGNTVAAAGSIYP